MRSPWNTVWPPRSVLAADRSHARGLLGRGLIAQSRFARQAPSPSRRPEVEAGGGRGAKGTGAKGARPAAPTRSVTGPRLRTPLRILGGHDLDANIDGVRPPRHRRAAPGAHAPSCWVRWRHRRHWQPLPHAASTRGYGHGSSRAAVAGGASPGRCSPASRARSAEGIRHGDWSAFRRHRLPEDDGEADEFASRTGRYQWLGDHEDRLPARRRPSAADTAHGDLVPASTVALPFAVRGRRARRSLRGSCIVSRIRAGAVPGHIAAVRTAFFAVP